MEEIASPEEEEVSGNIFYGQHSRMQTTDMKHGEKSAEVEARHIMKSGKMADEGFNLKS